jgi:Transposase, Mutator family
LSDAEWVKVLKEHGFTDAVIEELKEWQSRPLEPLYPILLLDALMFKVRHEERVENLAHPWDRFAEVDADYKQTGAGLWKAGKSEKRIERKTRHAKRRRIVLGYLQ